MPLPAASDSNNSALGYSCDRAASPPRPRAGTITEELHVGIRSVYAAAGFTEIGNPTPRRFVVRIDF